jgi:hypothetical protein
MLLHDNKQRKLETAVSSSFDLAALAWYSDVQHEIKPVTSDYRLVLTYNLVQDQSQPMQTAAALDASHTRFGGLLRSWNGFCSHIDHLIYPLKHQYTETSLSLQNLKGQDTARGRFLEQLCAANDAYWFLAHMTREICEGSEYEYGLDNDYGIRLGSTTMPSGERLGINLPDVEEDQVLVSRWEYFYEDQPADSEDEADTTTPWLSSLEKSMSSIKLPAPHPTHLRIFERYGV